MNPFGGSFFSWYKTDIEASFQYLLDRFDYSLGTPDMDTTTGEQIIKPLSKVGFKDIREQVLEDGMVIINAYKQDNN
ncbi:MAG: hypothetical protein ACW964_18875 [Candidatus Hodarchaeales archaeon]